MRTQSAKGLSSRGGGDKGVAGGGTGGQGGVQNVVGQSQSVKPPLLTPLLER